MRRGRRLAAKGVAGIAMAPLLVAASAEATVPAQDPLAARTCTAAEPNPLSRVEIPTGDRYALTFDEPLGPLTIRILEILDRYDARATFFLLGSEARRHPRLVRRIAARGHELANHTFSHPDLVNLSPRQRGRQLRRTQRVISRIAGVTPCFMRPPAMSYNAAVVRQAQRLGLGTVLWDVAADEVNNGSITATEVVATQTQPGSIVLFHQVPIAVWALPETLQRLLDRGLRATTVGALVAGYRTG